MKKEELKWEDYIQRAEFLIERNYPVPSKDVIRLAKILAREHRVDK